MKFKYHQTIRPTVAFTVGTVSIVVVLWLAISSGLAAKGEGDVKVVTVKAGDSVSFLAFKLYGKYNEQIEAAILSYNPLLKNINLIYPGQKLKFPRLSVIESQDVAEPKTPPAIAAQPPPEVEKKPPEIISKPPPEKEVAEKEPIPEKQPAREISGEAEAVAKKHETRLKAPAEKPPLRDEMVDEAAYVTYLKGKAEVKPAGQKKWNPIKVNQKVHQGDEVRMGEKSNAEIITFDQDVIRLSENTKVKIDKLQNNPVSKIKKKGFFIGFGRMWNKAKSLAHSKSEYTVSTPNAISGIRGTSYTVDVDQDESTRIKTYAGEVKVWRPQAQEAGPGWRLTKPTRVAGPHPVNQEEWTEILLKIHQELIITKQRVTKGDFDPLVDEKNDDWIRWNKQRDRELDESERFQ